MPDSIVRVPGTGRFAQLRSAWGAKFAYIAPTLCQWHAWEPFDSPRGKHAIGTDQLGGGCVIVAVSQSSVILGHFPPRPLGSEDRPSGSVGLENLYQSMSLLFRDCFESARSKGWFGAETRVVLVAARDRCGAIADAFGDRNRAGQGTVTVEKHHGVITVCLEDCPI